VILALRLREGLDLREFEARFGVDFEAVFGAPLQETLDLGLTELVDTSFTESGDTAQDSAVVPVSPGDARGELARGASLRLRLRDAAVLLGDEAFLRFLPDYAPA